jgi:hypothetical protein
MRQGEVMKHWGWLFVAGAWAVVLVGPASAQKQPAIGDIATCNQEADAAAVNPSASPRLPEAGPPKGGTLAGPTDPTGQIIINPADPLLEGMAAARADDPAFRMAYRACMQRLGY